eukprot:16452116-Heterocapsa_arctica.AAC.1
MSLLAAKLGVKRSSRRTRSVNMFSRISDPGLERHRHYYQTLSLPNTLCLAQGCFASALWSRALDALDAGTPACAKGALRCRGLRCSETRRVPAGDSEDSGLPHFDLVAKR